MRDEATNHQAREGAIPRLGTRFDRLMHPASAMVISMLLAMTGVTGIPVMAIATGMGRTGDIDTRSGSEATTEMTGEFYVAHATSPEDAYRLVTGRWDGTVTEGEAADDVRPLPDTGPSLGLEVAWLAVQMAGVASDQSGSLYEPSAYPWRKIDDPRLANEFAIMDATLGAYGGNNAYASCNQAACGVIAAVVDMDTIPFEAASGSPVYMQAYLSSHPNIYERVYPVTEDELMPGDILVTTNRFTHTAIWVGNEMAQTKFPGTTGNIYQAGYQEGDHARYPQIDCLSESDYEWVGYDVYRAIRRNTDSRYPSIDYRETIRQTTGQA